MRSPTARTGLVRRPSQTARAWIPGTPKATSAPAASRHSATSCPPVRTLTVCATAAILSRRMPRDPRHDVLFEPLQIGPKTLRNRFYAGAALHRLREREARLPGPFPRHEGGGRLGGGLHRVRARLSRLRLCAGTCPPVSGTRTTCEPRAHGRARPTSTAPLAGDRADPQRRPCDEPRVALPGDRALPGRERLLARSSSPRRWSTRTSTASGATGCGRRSSAARRGPRHRLRLRRALLPAAPVPLALLQQAHRRVRRLASRTVRASGSRRSRPCGRRSVTTARSPFGSASRRSGQPASSSTRASASFASPTTSSTSGT